MADAIENRKKIIGALRRELVGPDPHGKPLDCSQPIVFSSWEAARGPWHEQGTGEEILARDRPGKRYGVGVLHPVGRRTTQGAERSAREGADLTDAGIASEDVAVARQELVSDEARETLDKAQDRSNRLEHEAEEFDISLANTYRPCSMGVSFAGEFPEDSTLVVTVTAARYQKFSVTIEGEARKGAAPAQSRPPSEVAKRPRAPKNAAAAAGAPSNTTRETSDPPAASPADATFAGHATADEPSPTRKRTWWRRNPITRTATFKAADILGRGRGTVRPSSVEPDDLPGVSIELLARSSWLNDQNPRTALLTVCLVNRQNIPEDESTDRACLFQCSLQVEIRSGNGQRLIHPYPGVRAEERDDEEEEIDLLYRHLETFAIGHGAAADWADVADRRARRVSAECLPAFETPSVTPDIVDDRGERIEVAMEVLAGLVPGRDGLDELQRIISGYEGWIRAREEEAAGLEERYRDAAARHLEQCRRVAARMRDGLQHMKQSPLSLKAFRLANHAMLLQQLRNPTREPRERQYDETTQRWSFMSPFPELPHPLVVPPKVGRWRAFQIAFLLMTVRSMADREDDLREEGELIWFPTGGGKTEAYLGLAAFAIFLRRMRAIEARTPNEDAGVEVLMRYTLRLLTAQQFQRAAALIGAMEYLRRQPSSGLGKMPFKIGIWTGGPPNSREQARSALRQLKRGEEPEDLITVLDRCPWCRATLGRHRDKLRKAPGTKGRSKDDFYYEVHGYIESTLPSGGTTVIGRCPDKACVFKDGLPIEFVDEDIYDPAHPPVSMIIGTVDKFAMLARRPEARRIFGIAADGGQAVTPPGLVLQDELHLIAGPLGSMVGLYEAVIEHLCTDWRNARCVRPKIVTSTATIRSYRHQVNALFGRGPERVTLFPPPGLEAGDSYFARYATTAEGQRLPGRVYVGVHAPGLGSAQTAQVRSFASLLQAPRALPAEERDPWWTLLLFYNSIRELGGALTLFQTDIPDHLGALRVQLGAEFKEMRKLRRVRELTGRLSDDEVKRALPDLEVPFRRDEDKNFPVDVCLASNIIEVGVDIDRLSLMAVVGQPKTTAQYIQVTGLVGRRWWEKPGLVVTIYGASKPRDRSHFEKFRTYHERLYAQVEPTSVTPFSRPVLDRALHALAIIMARQKGDDRLAANPDPLPQGLMERLRRILDARIAVVDPGEAATLTTVLDRRLGQWRAWEPVRWEGPRAPDKDVPLMRWPREYVEAYAVGRCWETPSSMRNVDEECELLISHLYGPQEVPPTDGGVEEGEAS